jgi:hypothetical protein
LIGEKSPAALFADIGLDRRQKAWFLPAAPAFYAKRVLRHSLALDIAIQ